MNPLDLLKVKFQVSTRGPEGTLDAAARTPSPVFPGFFHLLLIDAVLCASGSGLDDVTCGLGTYRTMYAARSTYSSTTPLALTDVRQQLELLEVLNFKFLSVDNGKVLEGQWEAGGNGVMAVQQTGTTTTMRRSCSRAALHMTAMRKIGEGQGRVVKNLLHRPRIQYPRAGELHDLVTVAVGPTTPGGGRRRPDSGALESELHSCAGSMRSAGYRA
ncbi:hypothetical protein EDB83DRAFT_2320712 [Lactarius deliciosus]|nr:hypothetical protein EDB83DRAFT_2320712 [Lactarius deliciosus]